MRIGQITLSSENLTIDISAFTCIDGPRITNRMRQAWNEIPVEHFWDLMRRVSENFVNWNANHLRSTCANRIFTRHAARGSRHQFCRTTMTLSSENPRYIFMSIEIDRT